MRQQLASDQDLRVGTIDDDLTFERIDDVAVNSRLFGLLEETSDAVQIFISRKNRDMHVALHTVALKTDGQA